MEKDKQPAPDIDVTDETYAGPSAHIAALGTGVVKHYKWAIMGLIGGVIYALVDTKHTGQVIKSAREFANGLKAEPEATTNFLVKFGNEVKYTFGNLIHIIVGDEEMAKVLRNAAENRECAPITNAKTAAKAEEWFKNVAMTKEQGFGNWFASHTLGIIPGFGKKFKELLHAKTEATVAGVTQANDSKLTNALAFGGVMAFAGYVAGWAKALIAGAQHGNQGKRQFQRAQEQINSLKHDNDDLNKINDDLHEKYIKASTRLDTIQAAQENAARAEPPLASEMAAPMQAAAPATQVQLDQHQHEGKLAEKELAVA